MDRKLLLAILKVHDVQIDKEKVAKELSTDKQPCTTMAIQKRLQAIRTMIKDGYEGQSTMCVTDWQSADYNRSSTGNDTTPKAKPTPRKRGATALAADAGTPSKKGKGGKGKNARAASENEGGDEDGAGQDLVKSEGEEEDFFAL